MKKHVELQTPECLLRLVFSIYWAVVQHVFKMFTHGTCVDLKSLLMSFLFLQKMHNDGQTHITTLLSPVTDNRKYNL